MQCLLKIEVNSLREFQVSGKSRHRLIDTLLRTHVFETVTRIFHLALILNSAFTMPPGQVHLSELVEACDNDLDAASTADL